MFKSACSQMLEHLHAKAQELQAIRGKHIRLNPVTDSILCALLVIHSHIGFEACVIDYFPKSRVPKVRAAANWALRAATVLLGVALYSFETNDVGVTEAVRQLWKA